tara:strand:- start:464 stop:739 length:276 start_codon:yes stop_codon:yes gene_type:complete
MNRAELDIIIQQVLDAAPDKSNLQLTSIVFANWLSMYDQSDEWPVIMLAVTSCLAEQQNERLDKETDTQHEDVALAVHAADEFMAGILNKQ